ncbi:MAG: EF-P lysine aminoacylase EpmA [Planctomycetaceae bacterium]
MTATADDDWKPTCTLQALHLRSAVLNSIRSLFHSRGYLEVETPLLSHDIVVDAHLEPFCVRMSGTGSDLYLQTSPEAGMKRLLAAGAGSIFQITRSFRQDESGQRHNPEFSMLEWYGIGTTWHQQMQLTEDLVRQVQSDVSHIRMKSESTACSIAFSKQPFCRLPYTEAFCDVGEEDILSVDTKHLQQLVETHTSIGTRSTDIHDRDDLLNLLLAECVEPDLGSQHPVFLHSYPISQAALAEQNPDDARTACRFELYMRGLEICNGYQELTDVRELKLRDAAQNRRRTQQQSHQLPGATRLNSAMSAGLPPCSGVALGIDRLIMVLSGTTNIRDVIPFPIDRA